MAFKKARDGETLIVGREVEWREFQFKGQNAAMSENDLSRLGRDPRQVEG